MEQTNESPKRILLDALLVVSGYRQKRRYLRQDMIDGLEIHKIKPCAYLIYDLNLEKAVRHLVSGGEWVEEVARQRLIKADRQQRQVYDPDNGSRVDA